MDGNSHGVVRLPPRPLGPDEDEALHALIGSAYADFGVPFDPSAPEEAHLHDIEGIRASGGELWVIEGEGGLLVGSAALHLSALDGEIGAEIKTVYVHRDARRLGLGRVLMDVAMGAARSRGARRVTLWSDTRFTSAHLFYERLGFRRMGMRHTDGWDVFDEVGFECAL